VPSFGAQLRQERERQGVTLEDISLTTKISTRMLRALEEEHFDQLPGGIFNKGFIRAYARCLHMDEDQAIADYLAATGASPTVKKSEHNDQPPILDPPSREENPAASGLPWGTFAVVLLIVALGFAAWGFYSRESEKSARDSATQTANPPNPPPATTSAESSPAEKKNAESVDSSAANSKPSQSAVATTAPAVSTPSPSVNTTSASTSAASPPKPALPASGTFLVVIKAREDSWISISVDGEVVTRALMTAPAQKSVRAEKEIVIRAGNAGALDFEFNGNKLPTQGDYGEVKTVTFDARGLQPPAPKPEAPAQSPQPAQAEPQATPQNQ
jgi:cytoskeleton protein RodZ